MKTVKDMIIEIIESGITEPELAKLASTTQPSINRMRHGVTSDTTYTTGKVIESIYLERIDRPAA